jgi:hypothetical protein
MIGQEQLQDSNALSTLMTALSSMGLTLLRGSAPYVYIPYLGFSIKLLYVCSLIYSNSSSLAMKFAPSRFSLIILF